MSIPLVDLHNDVITCLSPKKFKKYIQKAEYAGVKAILISVWTTKMQDPMSEIQKHRKTIDETKTSIKLLLHIEDAWFLDEDNIDELITLKPYSVGLTWNCNNALAGGALDNGSLTPLGKSIVEKLVDNDIITDLAHLNRKSFFEVIKLCKKPLCSHTCFSEVHPHPRNIDREQIQAIINADGLIGLTLVGDFIGSNILNHIKYFLNNFGEDNLVFGTDFFGTKNLPKGLENYRNFAKFGLYLTRNGIEKETINRLFHKNYYEYNRS